ncbi:MAG TPA: M10 family metallopeptidase C-terminal domain-containing protein [Allosphingosinicella sp.]|nr:M10 family metallopeptidase C-terminal domain-containing protein [Allosphingosinicella sp.]
MTDITLHPVMCECGACGAIAFDANADGTGGAIAGKTVYTLDQVTANMNRTSYVGTDIPGPRWAFGVDLMGQNKSGSADTIFFGFYNTQSQLFQVPYVYTNAAGTGLVGRSEYFGFAPFSAAQQEASRKAIQLWDDLIKVTFVEQADARNADITFGNLTNAPNTQAYAFLPYNYGGNSAGLQGDIWVSLSAASNLQLGNGFYGLATLIHEFGHAIGLQHPGAYNAAPGLSITYAANAEYYQDTRMYSQMSYFNAEFSGGGHIDWNRLQWVYGQTPLLHDIATVHKMYGADPTTRTGDTVYGFNSNAGRDVYDFSVNKMPVISIYDAGGNDTLDFSGWNTSSTINLMPGSFSSGGGSGVVPLSDLKARGILPESYTEAQYLALRTRYNAVDGMLKHNISIAYGTIVENAIGGAGNDTITGNDVDNVLNGGAGDDKIEGRAGNDTIIGGLGADIMTGGIGNDLYYVDNAGDQVIELLGEGVDTVSSSISYTLTDNVENLILTGAALNGTGNALNNIITGNELGNTLTGGAGDDTLEGLGGNDMLDGGTGADKMSGGTGNDIYIVDNAGDQVIELAGEGTDTVRASISYTLGANIENLVLTGTAANGTGNGLDNVITGNALSNHLNGGAGNDRLIGGDGVDFLTGGAGNDIFVAEINATKVDSKQGPISLDVVLDFTRGQDKIDLSGIDANALIAGHQQFKFVGQAAGKGAGELSFQHFGNMNAAEKALGMELDGFDGDSPFDGPVTVLLGNVDGGDYDFAMVFVNTPTINTTDLIFV